MNDFEPTIRRLHVVRTGQSALEFALVAPVLILLMLVVVDLGRFFYVDIAIHGAARAGAQYGSQSYASAADATGMANAATMDWNNSKLILTVTPTQCTCVAESTTVPVCPTSYCVDDTQATFVNVTTQVTYSAVITYLAIPTAALSFIGIPTSGVLSSQAIMQVHQ
jgi:Flp pilus assembly protein TadG